MKRRNSRAIKVVLEIPKLDIEGTEIEIAPAFRSHLTAAITRHIKATCNPVWMRQEYVTFLRRHEERRREEFDRRMKALLGDHPSKRSSKSSDLSATPSSNPKPQQPPTDAIKPEAQVTMESQKAVVRTNPVNTR